MVQVYSEPLCRRHYAPVFSLAVLVRLALLAGSVVLAFILAYAPGGFWPKAAWELDQPIVHYSGDGLVVLEGIGSGQQQQQQQVWTTSPALQEALGFSAALASSVQVAELDANGDGRPDEIHFAARVATNGAAVHSARVLLQFTYELRGAAVQARLYALAHVAASSALAGARLSADGTLTLQQSGGPLRRVGYGGLGAKPPLDAAQLASNPAALRAGAVIDLPAVLADYSARNLTASLVGGQPVWTAAPMLSGGAASAPPSEFAIDVCVRVPPAQLVIYRPSITESLKWGWVQFLAAFAAVWWLATRLEWAAFRFRAVDARILSDVAPQAQRF